MKKQSDVKKVTSVQAFQRRQTRKALAKSTPTLESALREFGDAPKFMQTGFGMLADLLSAKLTPAQLVPLYRDLKSWETNFKDLVKVGRDKMLNLILEKGEQATENGTKKLVTDGWELTAQPRKTGYDSKKVEAMLRAKGLNPQQHMDAIVTYEVNDYKLQRLIDEEHIAPAEAEACKCEVAFNVMSPKRIDEPEGD